MPKPAASDLPDLPIFQFSLACNCRHITRDNITAAFRAGQAATGEELYDAALEQRLGDIVDGNAKRITGREMDKDGYGPCCGTCLPEFDQAAAHIPRKHPVIQIASAHPSRMGSCGQDCNTCGSAKASSCAPGLPA